MTYRINNGFAIDCGFNVQTNHVIESVVLTNNILSDLPASLYRSIDFKTTSSAIGAIFCETVAAAVGAIVNPIEKGHPDIVPNSAASATEPQLRNYPEGLEIKSTIGNIETGANLRAGVKRISRLTGLTWQAHHQEVKDLLGLCWDFATEKNSFNYPAITGVFYGQKLNKSDWGSISGTTGRNTKVSGMRKSGKQKMGSGWIVILDKPEYRSAFKRYLGTPAAAW